MLTELENRGIKIVKINLTIGQGVFNKIKVEDITRHPIHHEYFEVSLEAAETINRAIKIGRNVFAVGASVVRALESSVLTSGQVKPNKGWTDKFIYPQYNFKIANKLLTNFHLPASPQLLLTAAFADRELILKAYKRAIRDEYRFYAYGDAMLII
ncbi:S-adenosylmethionine:tRNA ribosyltransferase-isomerase [bioreactor metagenome]|uniref:S-adenosylmethionine:tRNA ribosyltransferase-isomerase n=1 Tax=bioreactor metagenome TaxID=1076179 RepID=A0A645IV71_9ZZZZ